MVKLTGNVRSEAEKELVSNDLANITGVKSVLNNLNIVDNAFAAAGGRAPTKQFNVGVQEYAVELDTSGVTRRSRPVLYLGAAR